jgi:hypothetical protein
LYISGVSTISIYQEQIPLYISGVNTIVYISGVNIIVYISGVNIIVYIRSKNDAIFYLIIRSTYMIECF